MGLFEQHAHIDGDFRDLDAQGVSWHSVGILDLGLGGRGGGASSGVSFFLGRAMAPESRAGTAGVGRGLVGLLLGRRGGPAG